MDLEYSHIQMGVGTLDSFISTKGMAKVFINPLLVGNMMVFGKMAKCMVMVFLPGEMAENILVNLEILCNKVRVLLYGQMVENMLVAGIQEVGMVMAN